MGAYAAGAGYYNQSTAVARSINADTVMRWNQYVYQSQMNANRIHAARLARDRNASIQDVDKIQKRLRDNPEPADIYSGDALNVALDEINDPRVYVKALAGSQDQDRRPDDSQHPLPVRLRRDHDEHSPAHQGAAPRPAPDT